MGSARGRLSCNLPTLLLQAYRCEEMPGDAATRVLLDTKSTSLLRVLLERRSDSTFLAKLHAELCDAGLPDPIATGHLFGAINAPSVSLRRPAAPPGKDEVLQA